MLKKFLLLLITLHITLGLFSQFRTDYDPLLKGMPDPNQVIYKINGANSLQTFEKQAGAFHILIKLIKDRTFWGDDNKQRRDQLIKEYTTAIAKVEEKYNANISDSLRKYKGVLGESVFPKSTLGFKFGNRMVSEELKNEVRSNILEKETQDQIKRDEEYELPGVKESERFYYLTKRIPELGLIFFIGLIILGIRLRAYGLTSGRFTFHLIGSIAYVLFSLGGLIMAFVFSAFVFSKYFH